jgi:regulator of protease activity HflC (stomatin/prohibitin superfamily)
LEKLKMNWSGMKMSFKALIGGAVVTVGALIFVIGGMSHVSQGYVGMAKHMSGEVTEILPGYHWTGWGVSVQDYPTYRQALGGKKGVTLHAGTGDQQELPVTANLNWNIDIKESKVLYQSVGGNDIEYIADTIVLPTLKNDINKVTHTYSWNAIKGDQQAEVTDKIEAMVKEDLAKSGIELVNFGFSNVGSPAGMAQSQQALATSELNIKKEKAKQEAAKIQNETKIMNAETQAKSNKILQESITDKLLQKQAIEKWDGHLPQVSGSNATPFINIK